MGAQLIGPPILPNDYCLVSRTEDVTFSQPGSRFWNFIVTARRGGYEAPWRAQCASGTVGVLCWVRALVVTAVWNTLMTYLCTISHCYPDWKINTDQTYSCPRDCRLSVNGSIKDPIWTHRYYIAVMNGGFQGSLSWPPMMPGDAGPSDSYNIVRLFLQCGLLSKSLAGRPLCNNNPLFYIS